MRVYQNKAFGTSSYNPNIHTIFFGLASREHRFHNSFIKKDTAQ